MSFEEFITLHHIDVVDWRILPSDTAPESSFSKRPYLDILSKFPILEWSERKVKRFYLFSSTRALDESIKPTNLFFAKLWQAASVQRYPRNFFVSMCTELDIKTSQIQLQFLGALSHLNVEFEFNFFSKGLMSLNLYCYFLQRKTEILTSEIDYGILSKLSSDK